MRDTAQQRWVIWMAAYLACCAQLGCPAVKTVAAAPADDRGDTRAAECVKRGLAYLSREVSQWNGRKKCFSCHNNGDGARVLYLATARSHRVDENVLADTTRWLAQPAQWQHNGGEGPFNDLKLANIQFAAALTAARKVGAVQLPGPLYQAADLLVAEQDPDGSWKVEAARLGSPVTYGTILATVTVRNVLLATDARRFQPHVRRAERWLDQQRPANVLDAAAMLLAADRGSAAQRLHCLQVIQQAQGSDGGWGPYANSAPEAFDTAVVVLALSGMRSPGEAKLANMIRQGRDFLVHQQLADGSWMETTRPADAESYAQRMSTTAWALEALLEAERRQAGR